MKIKPATWIYVVVAGLVIILGLIGSYGGGCAESYCWGPQAMFILGMQFSSNMIYILVVSLVGALIGFVTASSIRYNITKKLDESINLGIRVACVVFIVLQALLWWYSSTIIY